MTIYATQSEEEKLGKKTSNIFKKTVFSFLKKL